MSYIILSNINKVKIDKPLRVTNTAQRIDMNKQLESEGSENRWVPCDEEGNMEPKVHRNVFIKLYRKRNQKLQKNAGLRYYLIPIGSIKAYDTSDKVIEELNKVGPKEFIIVKGKEIRVQLYLKE